MEIKIDLSKCVKGQKVKDAAGRTEFFDRYVEDSRYPARTETSCYTKEGIYDLDDPNNTGNIVEILPIEQPDTAEEVKEEEPAKKEQTDYERAQLLFDSIDASLKIVNENMIRSVRGGEYQILKHEIDIAEKLSTLQEEIVGIYNL